MPIPDPVAAQIASLLNTQNELTRPYTAEMVLQHEDGYIIRSDETSALMGVVEAKRVQWYQCEIDHLSVQPKIKRQGLGSLLLEAAESGARDLGARIAQCTIRVGNKASEGLFVKHGYHATATFWNEESGNKVTVYQKVLKAPREDWTSGTECRPKIIACGNGFESSKPIFSTNF